MSMKRFTSNLLTPADVRRSASAEVDATVVPRPGTSEASANKDKQHQLSRRETGYASYGYPARDALVDDDRCSPHDEVVMKSPCVELCHDQEKRERQEHGYEGEVTVESTASADGRYPFRASLASPSQVLSGVKEKGSTNSGDKEIRRKFRHVTIRPRRLYEQRSSSRA